MTGPWIEQPAEGKDVTQKSVLYIETLQFICILTKNLIFFIPNSVWSSGDCWGNVIGLVGKSQCWINSYLVHQKFVFRNSMAVQIIFQVHLCVNQSILPICKHDLHKYMILVAGRRSRLSSLDCIVFLGKECFIQLYLCSKEAIWAISKRKALYLSGSKDYGLVNVFISI